MSDNGSVVLGMQRELEKESLELVIGKYLNFYAPEINKLLAESLYGQAVVSAALQRANAKRHLPSVKVLSAGSDHVLGYLTGDGTLFELLWSGISWTKGYTPPEVFKLYGLTKDGKYYSLPTNVQLTELPDVVFLVAVETKYKTKQHMLSAVAWAMKYASDGFRKNPKFVLDAVKQNGMALEYASAGHQNDPVIVIAAVEQNFWAMRYASYGLRKNPEFVLAVVSRNGCALQFASVELRADKKIALAAVTQDGWALKYVSLELQADREVVLVAVAECAGALPFASPELRADPEIRAAAGL